MLGSGGLPQSAGTEISALRITITIREGRTEFRLSAVVAPSGGAKAVDAIAQPAEHRTLASTNEQPEESPPPETNETGSGSAKKLKYPFTLLEIRENDEISSAPAVADTQA